MAVTVRALVKSFVTVNPHTGKHEVDVNSTLIFNDVVEHGWRDDADGLAVVRYEGETEHSHFIPRENILHYVAIESHEDGEWSD